MYILVKGSKWISPHLYFENKAEVETDDSSYSNLNWVINFDIKYYILNSI